MFSKKVWETKCSYEEEEKELREKYKNAESEEEKRILGTAVGVCLDSKRDSLLRLFSQYVNANIKKFRNVAFATPESTQLIQDIMGELEFSVEKPIVCKYIGGELYWTFYFHICGVTVYVETPICETEWDALANMDDRYGTYPPDEVEAVTRIAYEHQAEIKKQKGAGKQTQKDIEKSILILRNRYQGRLKELFQ